MYSTHTRVEITVTGFKLLDASTIMAAKGVDACYVVSLCLLVYMSFSVFKPCYLKSDGWSLTLRVPQTYEVTEETFFVNSLAVNRKKFHYYIKPTSKSLFMLLLILCGDIETCPGPSLRNVYQQERS